jgi:hypothetical protein
VLPDHVVVKFEYLKDARYLVRKAMLQGELLDDGA